MVFSRVRKEGELGVIRVKAEDGSIKEFRMNRARRRRFIRENRLKRVEKGG